MTALAAQAPQSGRSDYDQLVRFRQPRPGEPFFLLWGHDQVGAATIRDYASRIEAAGADPAMVESALQLADEFAAYGPKKLVDADHLTEAQRAQLAYQFQLRAWRAGEAAPGLDVALAEERGRAEAFARLRPIVRLLLEGGAFDEAGRFVFDPACRDRSHDKMRLEPHPCPIEGLRSFLANQGRQPAAAAAQPETTL